MLTAGLHNRQNVGDKLIQLQDEVSTWGRISACLFPQPAMNSRAGSENQDFHIEMHSPEN